ncbi:hypothetical protein SKAU_G00280170 [Synaphobranchus kaupii]|uniref:Murine leukemia virus integrase C-terminal domain-containing protein n=1 Tax=Synaphobranchus kaupii TaxID=118154 RepID=A0A9Q1INL7_SYNKA|nr:hypothetical protein SKAU_G00280170 [Synaphobranchus kaupii]
MLGLVERLPDIHEGAGKWIRALEEETMGKLLAVGDLKALLARLLGMARMEEVLMKSGLQAAVNTPYLDGASFDQFRPAMWRTLREDYPTKIDPKSLKGEEVGDTVNPANYLHRQLKRWKLETGRNPEGDELMTTLFRTSIVEAMPPPEKSREPETEPEVPDPVVPGDQVYLKVFRRKWNEPRREGPYKVVRATPTAVQVEGSTTWYHLNHCTRVPKIITSLPPKNIEDEPGAGPNGSQEGPGSGTV